MQGIHQNGSSSETDGCPGEQQQKWMNGMDAGWGVVKNFPAASDGQKLEKIRETCALTRWRETGFTELTPVENGYFPPSQNKKDIGISGRDNVREREGDKDKI